MDRVLGIAGTGLDGKRVLDAHACVSYNNVKRRGNSGNSASVALILSYRIDFRAFVCHSPCTDQMKTPNIDWRAIRPLDGAKTKGFEELCAQLARVEAPKGSRFERKGTPDAGVECYAVLKDGSEWGWQAKYFSELGASQWSQLDRSVRAALEKHPNLVRYFVCLPLDFPDSRLKRQLSAKDRWDQHKKKWKKWAAARGMSITFIYWGSHQLLAFLADPQHFGRVRFWFDVQRFDWNWFAARLDEAIKTAGPRYTPEVHVGLPIAADVDGFGRTKQFFDRVKAHALEVRESFEVFDYYQRQSVEPTLSSPASILSKGVRKVLADLGEMKTQPIGDLRFHQVAEHVAVAMSSVEEYGRLLSARQRECLAETGMAVGERDASAKKDSFRYQRHYLYQLSARLRETHVALVHAEGIAGSALLLVNGSAGTGKTHLLCDLAKQRIKTGLPTILLMGQRFVSPDAPWTQALQQLDLPWVSAEEFVGALEAAAQAADCRVLVIVDAINEGAGRLIWPNHLPAFLAPLERSPWIGVVLSVRSSYEEIVVPKVIRDHAVCITHHGFAHREYDATRTFFVHYGLELPSTPLLWPEFRNPLFLKTVCLGLKTKGERRLPRGFHGITVVFDLYINAINERLASMIDFNPKAPLTRRALERFVTEAMNSGRRWLPLSKAEDVINVLLPGRDFERSLYRALVTEGVLIEEAVPVKGLEHEEVAFVAYERFADHLIAKMLLDAHLDVKSPESSFAVGGSLAFLCDPKQDVSPGVLEAMCIHVPERTSRELIFLAPSIVKRWDIGEAFRQSIVWRAPGAFSPETVEAINKLTTSVQDRSETLDALLTVATIPDHPLNANFLDGRLRKDSMPDRDAWWSTYLHSAWGSQGAVDRLVDWAFSVQPEAAFDAEAVDLCAIALSWMLSTPNRFLRDHATQALVNLLTGRLEAVVRLVERFCDVDDPYILERVYAIAYGTSMRSNDTEQVGALACSVYARVFAHGSPPAHILLRDYARGVVERAICLGAKLDVDVKRVRPPYQGRWPRIPTPKQIKPLIPDWSRGSYDSGDIEWSRNSIVSSVMDGDFARYIIGTNTISMPWTALRIDAPAWEPPATRLAKIVDGFSTRQRSAWRAFEKADRAVMEVRTAEFFGSYRERVPTGKVPKGRKPETHESSFGEWERKRDLALAKLERLLTKSQARNLEAAISAKHYDTDREPRRFDLKLIQRYILWRVFDLGWTTQRFGRFDRFSVDDRGQEASKPERMGKKYQWIAYHEMMALIADNFKYRGHFGKETEYYGPWQDFLRDIDPSSTVRKPRGGTGWGGHTLSWWAPIHYERWLDPVGQTDWIRRYDDLPHLDRLLKVVNPSNGSSWLNVQGFFRWKQPYPPDLKSSDVERREIWYTCNGYLVRSRDASQFVKWAETVDFWNRWMPEPPEVYRMFLGEYAWSPAFRYFDDEFFPQGHWVTPERGCPVEVQVAAFEYFREANTFDCSVDEAYALRLPAEELMKGLQLGWNGHGADYLDSSGNLVAFDPTAHENGPSSLLLREDALRRWLDRQQLTICWTVLGEKRIFGPRHSPPYYGTLQMSGAYALRNEVVDGFLKCSLHDKQGGTSTRNVAIIRNRL